MVWVRFQVSDNFFRCNKKNNYFLLSLHKDSPPRRGVVDLEAILGRLKRHFGTAQLLDTALTLPPVI